MITATSKHLADKIAKHGAAYMTMLEPCIVERKPNGDMICDTDHPAWKEMLTKYRGPQAKPIPPEPTIEELRTKHPLGLGTVVHSGIDLTTLGLGDTIAKMVAKAFGEENCQCRARERCLTMLVPNVKEMSASDWIITAPKILACIGAKDENVK